MRALAALACWIGEGWGRVSVPVAYPSVLTACGRCSPRVGRCLWRNLQRYWPALSSPAPAIEPAKPAREFPRQLARPLLGAVLYAEGFEQPIQPPQLGRHLGGRRPGPLPLRRLPLRPRSEHVARELLGRPGARGLGERPEGLRVPAQHVGRDLRPDRAALHPRELPPRPVRVAVEPSPRGAVGLARPVGRRVQLLGAPGLA